MELYDQYRILTKSAPDEASDCAGHRNLGTLTALVWDAATKAHRMEHSDPNIAKLPSWEASFNL